MSCHDTACRMHVRVELKSLPVIAPTARAMKGDRERTLIAGMNNCLPMLIHTDAILRILARWGNLVVQPECRCPRLCEFPC